MELSIKIDEKMLSVIKRHTSRDVSSIIDEALSKWTNENILRCPLDSNFCYSKEPCNNCSKFTKKQ